MYTPTLKSCLPANILNLSPPRRRINQRSPCQRNRQSQIRSISNKRRNRSCKVRLVHTEYRTSPTHKKSKQRHKSMRQHIFAVPHLPVEIATSEDELVFCSHSDPDHGPVSNDGEEIDEDVEEAGAASNSNYSEHNACECAPDRAGNLSERGAELLKVESCGVCAWDVVRGDTEGENNTAEVAESREGRERFNDESANTMVLECSGPGRVEQEARSEPDAEEFDEQLAAGDAAGGHGHYDPAVGALGIVANVVRGGG